MNEQVTGLSAQAAVGGATVGGREVPVNRQLPRIDEEQLKRAVMDGISGKNTPPIYGSSLEKEGILRLAMADHKELVKKEKEYGSSWRKRGGVGAFMMMARKWDRIETQCERMGYDVFRTVTSNPTESGILDDIADLRRYLLLVEDHVREQMKK